MSAKKPLILSPLPMGIFLDYIESEAKAEPSCVVANRTLIERSTFSKKKNLSVASKLQISGRFTFQLH
jgi:hypothetical protein